MHTTYAPNERHTRGRNNAPIMLPGSAKGSSKSQTISKGRRGKISVDALPLDILIAVIRKLHPAAILRLSRTSKSFRSFLMNRELARASVWVPALKAIHELPPCPDHISEPKYTYMMFSDVFCDGCGSESATHLFITAQVMCISCLPKQ
ncbi:hypothetical protein FA13DRAFT_971909 [Coprinellus micaceus]|uniref:F-box domain-containing protein n=1 Tax=Coprinellus micaceus TaxID=71717 RepID=A0A4Y7SYU0_COPMI|nr:hypothetical protein FA13DRAFT_971909 [Coprinellus micaceus]